MMTPREKAIELVNKYRVILMSEDTDCGNEILCMKIAKQCALIAVDEILEAPFNHSQYVGEIPQDAPDTSWYWDEFNKYWNDVKQEIEGL